VTQERTRKLIFEFVHCTVDVFELSSLDKYNLILYYTEYNYRYDDRRLRYSNEKHDFSSLNRYDNIIDYTRIAIHLNITQILILCVILNIFLVDTLSVL